MVGSRAASAVSFDELATLVGSLQMGPLVVAHTVNTAMRIMSARYPSELVRIPLPPQYDLRAMLPALQLTDQQHDIARAIFNRRTVSHIDLADDDIAADLEHVNAGDQVAVFVALFYMYGTKIGAMKNRTGID